MAAPLMPATPIQPPLHDLIAWLAQARQTGADQVAFAALPANHARLPDVLAFAGIASVLVPGLEPCHWFGSGPIGVQVNPTPSGPPAAIRRGPLPGAIPPPLTAASLEQPRSERRIAAAWLPSGSLVEGTSAWNPMPFRRRALVAIPWSGPAPSAFADDRGRRYVAQRDGNRVLIELDLEALECTSLIASAAPTAGCHWEVGCRVLDNGRVRAEFDELGHLARLCWDGLFADFAGPAARALIDGEPVTAPTTVRVVEGGPVRAIVAVERTVRDARLVITYELRANGDALHVSATWDGPGELTLEYATEHRTQIAHAGDDLQTWRPAGGDALTGLRTLALGDESGRGLAVCSGAPFSASVLDGRIRLGHGPRQDHALVAMHRSPRALPLTLVAQSLESPHRSCAGPARPPAFRLAGSRGLSPSWVRRPDGWDGELLCVDTLGARGRALFLPHREPGMPLGTAVLVDPNGTVLRALPATPEGDGFTLDHAAGEILLLRWRSG